ncbi:hypothetical protein [Proteus hauseri]|uniref:hypothetical protein n=1 Tax=Proteus hauseri TaxID=183417 RepID=UPI0032DB6C15
MKIIYLDHNIYCAYIKKENKNPLLLNKIDSISKIKYIFPYSPAHIEEVAEISNSKKDQKDQVEFISILLHGISSLSYGREIFPNHGGPTRIITESPLTCFDRVFKTLNTTEYAKENERRIYAFKNAGTYENYFKEQSLISHDIDFTHDNMRKRHKIDIDKIKNLSNTELMSNKFVLSLFMEFCEQRDKFISYDENFENFKHDHSLVERKIDCYFRFLEIVGYYTEPYKRCASRMHDVTHAIYATKADFFITNDYNFHKKIKATYTFFKIPTIILNIEEFTSFEF